MALVSCAPTWHTGREDLDAPQGGPLASTLRATSSRFAPWAPLTSAKCLPARPMDLVSTDPSSRIFPGSAIRIESVRRGVACFTWPATTSEVNGEEWINDKDRFCPFTPSAGAARPPHCAARARRGETRRSSVTTPVRRLEAARGFSRAASDGGGLHPGGRLTLEDVCLVPLRPHCPKAPTITGTQRVRSHSLEETPSWSPAVAGTGPRRHHSTPGVEKGPPGPTPGA